MTRSARIIATLAFMVLSVSPLAYEGENLTLERRVLSLAAARKIVAAAEAEAAARGVGMVVVVVNSYGAPIDQTDISAGGSDAICDDVHSDADAFDPGSLTPGTS